MKVGVVMGSRSDWEVMQHAVSALEKLGIAHEVRVVSAHRTPDLLFEYASTAESRGIAVIIAGAGGAAHLPGMLAAKTHVPVLGVPVTSAGGTQTVAGLLIQALGRIPRPGERFTFQGLEFDVLAASATRVERVAVRVGPVRTIALGGARD